MLEQSFTRKTPKERALQVLLYICLLAGAVIILLPFYWMLSSSFKTSADIWIYPPELIPKSPTLMNYVNLVKNSLFPRHFLNSIIVTLGYTGLSLFFYFARRVCICKV